MVSEASPGQSTEPSGQPAGLAWLLTELLKRVPHSRTALLLSSDGLRKAEAGMDIETAEAMSALSSSLFSLARSAGYRLAGGDHVRQVIVELDSTLLCVCSAGQGSCLAVFAGREADAGILGYEMNMLAKKVRDHLATPARQTARP